MSNVFLTNLNCDVPTRCTRTDKLLSWVIRAPSAQHAVVNGRSHWTFGQLPSILTMPNTVYLTVGHHLI